jgi:hypothetical protein
VCMITPTTFHTPSEPYRRPSIHWLHQPIGEYTGMVEIDGDVWTVEYILGDLEGYEGPQQVGFTFKTLVGGEVKVYFEPGGRATCSCGKEPLRCRHIEALRRLNE